MAASQAPAAASQSPADSHSRQLPQVPLAQLIRCCLAQGAYARRNVEGLQHRGANAVGQKRRPGGKAAAAAASRLLATAVAGLAGLLTASGVASAAAGQRPLPMGKAAAQTAANAGASDMQPLLRQFAELAKDAWTHAEQMPELAPDLMEVMGCHSAAASSAQRLQSCRSPASGSVCTFCTVIHWRGWCGRAGLVTIATSGPARLLQSGCTIMADVAMAGCSDLGTHAAAMQGSRGKLQRILATADYRRLEPLFQQVVIRNFETARKGGSQHVCDLPNSLSLTVDMASQS